MIGFKEFTQSDNDAVIAHDPIKKIITLCAYCDKDESEKKKWIARGYDKISHGICPRCNEEQERILASLK